MNRIIAVVMMCLTMVVISAQAQKKWSLQECIDYALTNNIQLQKNKISALSAEQDVISSKAARIPSLSFNTNQNAAWRPYSQQTINLTNGTMTTSQSEVNYNGSYALSGNWTIWNGGKIQKNIERSQYAQRIAELNTAETANSIQEQIAQIYIQILYEYEAVRIDSETVKKSQLQVDRAREMEKVGNLAKVDVAQLEAQLTQDQYTLVSAQSQLETYKLRLKQLLEIHGEENFDVAVPTIMDDEVLKAIPTKQAIYKTALQVRPEIESGKLSIESSKLEKKIAKAGLYPTISANAGIGTSNTSGAHKNVFTQFKNNLSNSIGLSLQIPIFDQKQTKTAVQKAELAIMNSELDLQSTQKEIYSSVEEYWLNATTAQQQYKSAQTNVQSMQQSYDLVSEQFRLGLKNIVELTTGKNNLLQAQSQLIQSKYTAIYNMAMLRFYQGEEIKL